MRFFKVIALFFIASYINVSAQTVQNVPAVIATSTKPINTKQAIVLATVNIYNATSTQEGNTVTVSFDITNRVGVQPGIKYGITLIKDTPTGQVVVNEHVYDEILSLGENSSIHKVVTYQLPPFLEGTYKLFVSSKNMYGFSFGITSVGDVIVTKGTLSGLFIHQDTCFLTVEGEKSNAKYTPMQGVDIALTETLLSNCVVENMSSSTVAVTSIFVTRARSNFGDIVPATGGDVSPVSFAPHEKKMIITKLPKAINPQLHSVNLHYGVGSNEMSYYYIIQGYSGTIKNIIFDKDVYYKGDVANLSFIGTVLTKGILRGVSSGSTTQLTQTVFNINLKDEYGDTCASTFTDSLDAKAILIPAHITITKDCIHPIAEVSIFNPTVGTLSQASFTTGSITLQKHVKSSSLYFLSIVLILVFFVMFFLFYVRKIKFSGVVSVFFFVVSIVSTGVMDVKADTISLMSQQADFNGWIIGGYGFDVTINPNKSSYAPGENILFTVLGNGINGSANVIIGANTVWVTHGVSSVVVVPASPSGITSVTAWTGDVGCDSSSVGCWTYDSGTLNFSYAYLTAPTVTLNPFTPASIQAGQTSTISFSSTDTTGCTGTGIFSGALGTSAVNASTPVMNTAGTYTQSVTCTGPGGSATSVTRSLTVTPAVPVINLWFTP